MDTLVKYNAPIGESILLKDTNPAEITTQVNDVRLQGVHFVYLESHDSGIGVPIGDITAIIKVGE
jgi:hypothetical protein